MSWFPLPHGSLKPHLHLRKPLKRTNPVGIDSTIKTSKGTQHILKPMEGHIPLQGLTGGLNMAARQFFWSHCSDWFASAANSSRRSVRLAFGKKSKASVLNGATGLSLGDRYSCFCVGFEGKRQCWGFTYLKMQLCGCKGVHRA